MDFKKIPNSNSVGNFFASPPKITDRQGVVTNNKKMFHPAGYYTEGRGKRSRKRERQTA
jgi:hypothetical protein